MRDTLHDSLQKLRWTKTRKHRTFVILLVLSLLVSADVFWVLRQPGLTLAGDAACGIQEHHHDETCRTQICICESTEEQHTHEETCFAWETSCVLEEHSHEIICYSDATADVETQLDWQELFAAYPYTGDLRKDLVGIAQTQVGYSESEMNYEVGTDGVRRGYTRYGAWYGAPYGDWSAMFVSFCLHYAGADPAEAPGNTGADSMALLWDNLDKYAPAGTYTPSPGDLVFFYDNTVGIVTEVQEATCYVIRGDVNEAVCGEVMSLNDPSIDGWGLTEGTVSTASMPLMMIQDEGGTEGTDTTEDEVIDLMEYLEDCEGSSYSFVLKDDEGGELPEVNGSYAVYSGKLYNLILTIDNPAGFAPGTYQYQIPNGQMIKNGIGNGIIKVKNEDIGRWTVDNEGVITIIFNENADGFSGYEIEAEMEIVFPEQEIPIDFDGIITVTVEKPPEKLNPTVVYKWGSQGGPNKDGPDTKKIYWTVQLIGNTDSEIPGSVITDRLMTDADHSAHHYTESDMANGLVVIAAEKNPVTGEEYNWHTWTVHLGDPALNWAETSWSYQMPETAVCDWCGTVDLGNADWNYMVKFSSTPDPADLDGALKYWNQVNADGQTTDANWVDFVHGEKKTNITKNGTLHGDAGGGAFLWEIQIDIPGMKPGQRADFDWFIIDNMDVRYGESTVGYWVNDLNHAVITASGNGNTFTVPHIYDATEADLFAWHIPWTDVDANGNEYHRQMKLLCRCNCTEESCSRWENGQCNDYWYEPEGGGDWVHKGFCQCWAVEQDTTFTITYGTEAPELIERYGGVGNVLRNTVLLRRYEIQPDGTSILISAGDAADSELIPGVFKKELKPELDGYIANYVITVNEGKLVLTNGTPLTIYDEMSETLAFISGSLVITTEDADGNTGTLQQGVDYTAVYDGTGDKLNTEQVPVHVLEIEIKHPQPVKYILDYDAALMIPEGTSGTSQITNSASVTLWGRTIADSIEQEFDSNLSITADNYGVDLYKKASHTGEPLEGALFGLFNENGGLISSDKTDENGQLRFKTSIKNGIVLQDHELYYLQELEAPPGYQMDDEPYWFCFCDKTTEECAECDAVMGDIKGVRIPYERIGKVDAVNERMNYSLPATGGPGIYPLVFISVILIITSLIYGLYRRCKRERRNVG